MAEPSQTETQCVLATNNLYAKSRYLCAKCVSCRNHEHDIVLSCPPRFTEIRPSSFLSQSIPHVFTTKDPCLSVFTQSLYTIEQISITSIFAVIAGRCYISIIALFVRIEGAGMHLNRYLTYLFGTTPDGTHDHSDYHPPFLHDFNDINWKTS